MNRKIFTYNTEIAKRNGNYISIGGIILMGLLVSAVLALLIFCGNKLDSKFELDGVATLISLIIFMAVFIFVIIISNRKTTARLTSIVIDDGKKYVLINRKDGRGTMLATNVAGSAVDMLSNDDSILGDTISTVGAIIGFFRLNSSFKDMENKEKVNEFFDKADKSIMFKKIRIDKINSVCDKNKYYEIICDYTKIRNNKSKKNKKLKIYKVYDNIESVLNI